MHGCHCRNHFEEVSRVDPINRQEVLAETGKWLNDLLGDDSATEIRVGIRMVRAYMKKMSAVKPEQKTCEGCKHRGQWENELEYGASCPCLVCKRRASDNYERSD